MCADWLTQDIINKTIKSLSIHYGRIFQNGTFLMEGEFRTYIRDGKTYIYDGSEEPKLIIESPQELTYVYMNEKREKYKKLVEEFNKMAECLTEMYKCQLKCTNAN